jgi:hypothetical protein
MMRPVPACSVPAQTVWAIMCSGLDRLFCLKKRAKKLAGAQGKTEHECAFIERIQRRIARIDVAYLFTARMPASG